MTARHKSEHVNFMIEMANKGLSYREVATAVRQKYRISPMTRHIVWRVLFRAGYIKPPITLVGPDYSCPKERFDGRKCRVIPRRAA